MPFITPTPFLVDPALIGENPIDSSKYHIVATANKRNSFCINYLGKRGMQFSRIIDFCDKVESHDDPGTLFPNFQFTLIPCLPLNKGNELDKLNKYFREVVKAHVGYFKNADTLLLVFDKDSGYTLDQLELNLNQVFQDLLTTYSEIGDLQIHYVVYP